MGDGLNSLIAFETELGGVLLANMLEAWLDAEPNALLATEPFDELQDHGRPSAQTRLCVCAPVDDGASTPSSRVSVS